MPLASAHDAAVQMIDTSIVRVHQHGACFGCGTLRAVRAGKPWRLGLPERYVERLDALKHYYYALSDMRADLVSIREGLSSSESGKLAHEHPSLSGLSAHITAAIVLLECAENKLFSLLPREEFAPLAAP
jgi:hypothetical protein